MKQVDTKKLVLACLVIMVLMIIYTRIDLNRQHNMEAMEAENEAKREKTPGSLLLAGNLDGFHPEKQGQRHNDGSADHQHGQQLI